ncbi:MAG TPA: hypothetical protein VG890_03830 [Puia sp.]|nr:hypothetical protein [Puia sp.]
MNAFTIDKKAYVILPKKEYEHLVAKAASKASPSRKLSLIQGKKLAYKLIDQWSKEK